MIMLFNKCSYRRSSGQSTLFFILLIISLMLIAISFFQLLKQQPNLPATETEIATASLNRPQRIVSQTLATDEILLALCPTSRIVALSTLARDARYSNIVEKAQAIAGQASNNVEQILSFNPDIIFVASYSRAETVELLQAAGAPVFRFAHFKTVADIKNNIKTIGNLIGEPQNSAALIAQMENYIKSIRANIPADIQPPRVMSYSFGNYTAGSHTTFDNMVNIVGAINVAAEHGIVQHAKISEEQILAMQPDFIVTHAAVGEFAQVRSQLLENPAIAASEAGKAGRIIVIDNRYFLSVSQYIIFGIKSLAKGLYGY